MKQYDDARITETELSRERVFNGIILKIDHVMNRLPNGREAAREIAVHVGASAVVPVDREGNVYLVRQFRAPISQVLLEIPAGKLDSVNEDRLLAAKRELEEETGFVAEDWKWLTDIHTTPGFSNERISLYLARSLKMTQAHPDEDEFLNVVKVPFTDALAMAENGELTDAKTIIALMLARQYI